MNYYNDTDEYCCNWLANLMLAGLIPRGDIDQRSIRDVAAKDLRGYTQCHFFAGLGGWPLALRLAEWPESREVWTGSCPCQPFSVAGKQKGFGDDRHLWPAFRTLIEQRRPIAVFGEQVAKAPDWLNLVRSGMEALGYALGVVPIEAASAGADHLRDRYFFVADGSQQQHGTRSARARRRHQYSDDGFYDVAHHDREQPSEGLQRSGQFSWPGCAAQPGPRGMADDDDQRSQIAFGEPRDAGAQQPPVTRSYFQHMVNSPQFGWGEGWTEHEFRRRGFSAAVANCDGRQYLECPDGKWRRLPPPRVRWLGNGIPARVAKLRAIGNAIDPRPPTAFIKAYMELTE